MSKFIRLTALAFMLAFAGATGVMAQSTVDGAIGGVVKDPNGAVVNGAAVTIRNEGTNEEKTATTDDEGRFRVTQLQPGNYTVTINATGFGAYTQQAVVVEVGRVTSLNIDVAITATESVEVSAEAPVINTVQQDFSTNINQTSINELPINGRRASEFVRLTPGVVPDGDFGLNSFRGISGLLNNSTVDGGDNNNSFFSEERGRTRISYVISQSAVREFQVNTSNYSAEYGRAAGGVVNTVTKSGTNDFHGDLFYYIRDNRFGARNPSATRSILNPDGTVTTIGIKPSDRRQQFGGTIGGRIVRDRLFFFFSYDQQKRNFPAISQTSNPAAFNPISVTNPSAVITPTGLRSCTNNRGIAFSSGETLFCRNVTQAQATSGIDFLRGLTGEVPRSQDQYIILPKIDWRITDNNTFTATYNRFRSESPSGIETPPVRFIGRSSFGDDFVNVDSLTLRLTSTITPTILNEFRFQTGRELATAFATEPTAGELTQAARATTLVSGTLPQFSIGGTGASNFIFGSRNFLDRRAFPDERRFQFADTMTLSRGNHTFRFGFDIKHDRDIIDNLRNEFGAYSYNNVVDYLSDFADPAGKRYSNFTQAFGLTKYEFSTPDYGFFIQDDWRVTPRLTLNLGLRYEYQDLSEPQFPNATTVAAANLSSNNRGRFTTETASALIAQTASFPSDANNFGPRVGFAYDLTGDGKTSVRGGFGVYYGRIPNSFISSAITNTGAPGSQFLVSIRSTDTIRDANGNIIPTPIYPNTLAGIPGGATGSLDITTFSPALANPRIMQGDLIIEREIARNTVISASYLFSAGRSLTNFVDANLPSPSATATFTVNGGQFDGQSFSTPLITGARPITNFRRIIEIQSSSRSKYNALVLQANRRLTDGLQFQINYTYSSARDFGQTSSTFAPSFSTVSDPFNIGLDEGRSNLNIPHRFVASAVYAIGTPFGLENSRVGRAIFGGFQIAPIVSISSGRPDTGTLSGDSGIGTAGRLNGGGGPFRAFFIERNSFRNPSTASVDLRLSRRFRLGETANIEFLAEAFNLFNRSNVTDTEDTIFFTTFNAGTNTGTLEFNNGQRAGTSAFLEPTVLNNNTIFRERQIQFALRFQF